MYSKKLVRIHIPPEYYNLTEILPQSGDTIDRLRNQQNYCSTADLERCTQKGRFAIL